MITGFELYYYIRKLYYYIGMQSHRVYNSCISLSVLQVPRWLKILSTRWTMYSSEVSLTSRYINCNKHEDDSQVWNNIRFLCLFGIIKSYLTLEPTIQNWHSTGCSRYTAYISTTPICIFMNKYVYAIFLTSCVCRLCSMYLECKLEFVHFD